MSNLIQKVSRRIEYYSSTSGVVPTCPIPGTNYVDDTWLPTDIFPGELFINTADGLIFTNDGNQIIKLNQIDSLISGLIVSGTSNPLILTISSGLVYINGKIYEFICIRIQIQMI